MRSLAEPVRSLLLFKVRLVLVVLWAGLFLNQTASATSDEYHADFWRTDEGLPQSSITAILQTHDDYLWLGTFGGLSRFDGVRFKTMQFDAASGASSSRVLSLFEARDGVLWVGTEEGDLVELSSGRLTVHHPPNRGTASKYARSFLQTSDGAIWFNTAEGQLFRSSNGKFDLVSGSWTLSGMNANAIGLDVRERFWIGTERELAQLVDGKFHVLWGETNEARFRVEALARSAQGGMWVAGGGRVRRFDGTKWAADYGVFPWLKGVLTCLHEDRKGQLWIGTYGSGLFRYGTNGAVLKTSRRADFPENFVRSICEDQEGNIWVGTEGRGLARLKPSIFSSVTRADGLSGDLILSVCEGADGELWIGTNGEGVNRLKNGAITHYRAEQGLTNECVWSVLVDRSERVWAGTWGGGLFRLEGDSFLPIGDRTNCSTVVCALYEDSNATIWLGQIWNQPAITQWSQEGFNALRLPTRVAQTDARVIMEDSRKNIWVGTRGDGLYRLGEGDCKRFSRQDGLGSNFILSLYNDAEGTLWIGTREGLSRLKDGKFATFSTREGLVNDLIFHITEDRSGYLWFGSGKGVFRVRKADLESFTRGELPRIPCLAYTKADGLPSMESSSGCQPAGCRSRDGRLWFPTINGLAVVDPQSVPVNPRPPAVMIEEVLIEDENEAWTLDVATLGKADPDGETSGLRVPPGKPRFEFRYTGLSFTAPEKVHFKYKLEPLEQQWVEAGSRRSVVYSYLQPGRYRFRVLACNNDGVWNESGAVLGLVLLPHFWQTWWFRMVVLAAVLLLFVAIYEIRLATERRVTRLRLRIARDLHDEVGSNLGSIALLSEVAPRQRSGSPEELPEIRRIAVQTIDSLRDIVWFLDPANHKLNELVLRMKETARTMLPGMAVEFETAGDLEKPEPSFELRRNLFPMFKEILHNIARHAQATQVSIYVESAPRAFRLRVRDNGCGFAENAVKLGNGLKNLRRRAAEMGATMHIDSTPGNGTCVTLEAPIP